MTSFHSAGTAAWHISREDTAIPIRRRHALPPACVLSCLAFLGGCAAGRLAEVSGGVLAASYGALTSGTGWYAAVGVNTEPEHPEIQVHWRARYDAIASNGEDGLQRVSIECYNTGLMTGDWGLIFDLGWMGFWTDGDAWGTGPIVGIGAVFAPSQRLGMQAILAVGLWGGSDDDAFSGGVSGEASLGLYIAF